ncbi:hypothetical protein NKDENANG_00970 [Candidatus Entotheonellaceae bacterium PAL068K]
MMSDDKVILVVGLIAEDNADHEFLPQEAFADFEEQTVYEVGLRLRMGKPLPDCLMTTVGSQEELQALAAAVKGRGIRLALMTDARGRDNPRTLEALLAQLPQLPPRDHDNDVFHILP